MRTGTMARAFAVSGAVLLAATACSSGSSGSSGSSSSGSGEKAVTNIYGSDGNMGSALGDQFKDPGALAGMKGTTPLTDLSADFKKQLDAIDPKLGGTYNYAGESHDAVILVALAATAAGTNDAKVFAPYINGLTTGGDKCTDFAGCAKILAAGGDVDFDGASGPLDFATPGEPAVASFGLLQFGTDNKIDDSKTKFQVAGDDSKAVQDAGPKPVTTAAAGGPLTIGTLLPLTGSLAFLGPPEVAGVKLAVKEVNDAGGALGAPVALVEGDSGDTSTDTANTTVDRLLASNVNAIIGAASSAVTLTVVDKIAAAGVVEISPANTSDTFTTYNDQGMYFRTAPPDVLQAVPLADLVLGDGNTKVGILNLNDPYGKGLSENVAANLVKGGLSKADILSIAYDPTASSYDTEVQKMVEFGPDAIVVIGFDESARIIQELNAQGIGPAR